VNKTQKILALRRGAGEEDKIKGVNLWIL